MAQSSIPKRSQRPPVEVVAAAVSWPDEIGLGGSATGRLRPRKGREGLVQVQTDFSSSEREQAKWLVGRRRERLSLYRAVGFSFLRVRRGEDMVIALLAPALRLTPEKTVGLLDELAGEQEAGAARLTEVCEQAKLPDRTRELLGEFLVQRKWLIYDLARQDNAEPGSEEAFAKLVLRVGQVGQCAGQVQAEFGKLLADHGTAGKPHK